MPEPLAYLITFTCYGRWLHGDRRGSVDDDHNGVGESLLPPNAERRRSVQTTMTHPAYQLDSARRTVVLQAIRNVCHHRNWRLWAAHVRAQHAHIVVTAVEVAPEDVMNDFKAYASRALNAGGFDRPSCKRWTRHGSTRYINDERYLHSAINYVLFEEGPAQAVYDGRDDTIHDPIHEPRSYEPRP